MQPPRADQPPWPDDKCGCGEDLHYTQPDVQTLMEDVVQRRGPLILLPVDGVGSFWVPRHFIVLHNIPSEADIPALAERYGFPKFVGPRRLSR